MYNLDPIQTQPTAAYSSDDSRERLGVEDSDEDSEERGMSWLSGCGLSHAWLLAPESMPRFISAAISSNEGSCCVMEVA